jgi:hypothetical protein
MKKNLIQHSEKIVLSFIAVLVCMQLNAKKSFDWTMPEGELINVFVCAKDGKKTELLRIFSDGQYEHLLYETKSGNKEFVLRITGNWALKRRKITFLQPENRVFNGKFKYGSFFVKEHLYLTRRDMLFARETPKYRSELTYMYSKPFFMCLYNETIVHNKEAQDGLDLEALVAFFKSKATSEKELVENLEWFIIQSLEYDDIGFETKNLTNDQYDIYGMLAGPIRLAVCAGYANILCTMAEMAGIKVQKVKGYTRSRFSEISKLAGYHAWNRLTIDGEEQLHDLTWADYGNYIDFAWINVRPEIMIGSHFPDRLEDQLLDTPVLQSSYLNSACLLAFEQDAEIVHSFIPATLYLDQKLNLTFAKDAKVSFYRIEEDVLYMNKSFEKMRVEKELYLYPVSNYTCDKTGDSAVYHFDISSFITVFNVEVNNAYSLMFVVVKGSEQELLQYYTQQTNDVNYDQYLKAILSAIKLKDYDQLKKIVGADSNIFFDKNGALNLSQSVLQSIENWDGSLSDLEEMTNKTIEKISAGKENEQIWKSYYTEIPNGLTFTLLLNDGHYSVSSIE